MLQSELSRLIGSDGELLLRSLSGRTYPRRGHWSWNQNEKKDQLGQVKGEMKQMAKTDRANALRWERNKKQFSLTRCLWEWESTKRWNVRAGAGGGGEVTDGPGDQLCGKCYPWFLILNHLSNCQTLITSQKTVEKLSWPRHQQGQPGQFQSRNSHLRWPSWYLLQVLQHPMAVLSPLPLSAVLPTCTPSSHGAPGHKSDV